MQIDPIGQSYLLALCALIGALAGTAFDITGIFSDRIRRRGVRAFTRGIFDFFIVVCTAVTLIIACFYFNSGEVRFFCFVGCFSGLLAYKLIMSWTLKFVFCKILDLVCALFGIIWSPFAKILGILANFSIKFVLFLKNKLFKSIENTYKLMYNIYVRKKLLKSSGKGFLKALKK